MSLENKLINFNNPQLTAERPSLPDVNKVEEVPVILEETTIKPILAPDVITPEIIEAEQTNVSEYEPITKIEHTVKIEPTINEKTLNNNLKETLLTNEEKTKFYELVAEALEIYDETENSMPAINLVGGVILELIVISEKCIDGREEGAIRELLVFNESVNYLLERNVSVDENLKTVLRGYIEATFELNENKLSKIFSDIYETGKSCIGSCTPLMSILNGVIPVMK